MILTPKNWASFQHYKDRAPIWIKLHRSLLDDYEFNTLPLASRALAPMLWLLASEYEGGQIDASPEKLCFRLRVSRQDFLEAIKPLVAAGFFLDDSGTLAEREQTACPEKRHKEEVEEQEREDISVAEATLTRLAIAPRMFDEFWGAYPRRDGRNPKEPARKKFVSALKSGEDPNEIIAAARRYTEEARSKGQIDTPYVAQAITWLNQQSWKDYRPPPGNAEKQAEQEAYMASKGFHWNGEKYEQTAAQERA